MSDNSLVVPIRGLLSEQKPWEGQCEKKPWEYEVTAVIPVLDTVDTLEVVVQLLLLQTVKPFVMIIDTGSTPDNFAKIEALRAPNVEVHAIRMHGTPHPSDFPATAMDLAFSLCRTKYLFATHADCFLRKRDFLEYEMSLCTSETPVVGYELSPRAHPDWKGMIGHTVTMFHMHTMDLLGAGWSLRRLCNQFGIPWEPNANGDSWPDTELCLNYLLREKNIKPLLIGHDINYERQVDDNIDHVRSLTGAMLYSPNHYTKALKWKEIALNEAKERVKEWQRPMVKDLVCVMVYKRIDNVVRWLRVWQIAERFGAKIAVIHNCDGDQPDPADKARILELKPDYYVPRPNVMRDIGAFRDVATDKLGLPDCTNLYWFTDDLLPMRPTFLKPFVQKLSDPAVGLVGQCFEPASKTNKNYHIRTVAFGIKKCLARRLAYPEDEGPGWAHAFESGDNNMTLQVEKMGYRVEVCHGGPINSERYLHWTSFLDWIWDCDLCAHCDLWELFEDQFRLPHIRRRDDVKTHPHLLLDVSECERLTLLPRKVTAILATSQCPLPVLAWCVLSLLCRSNRKVLEHIIVSINGPDARTGDPSLQDRKQAFLEDLRNLKWQGDAMPITVQRTWSRLGHSQAIESCIPWVHTEGYLLMHDDVIVTSPDWLTTAETFFDDPEAVCCTYGDLSFWKLQGTDNNIQFPILNSIFNLCRKSLMTELGCRWWGYHIPFEYYVGELVNYKQWLAWHDKHGHVIHHINGRAPGDPVAIPKEDYKYKLISMDTGTFFYDKVINSGYHTMQFGEIAYHIEAASWRNMECVQNKWPQQVLDLESDIQKCPELWNLYLKYVGDVRVHAAETPVLQGQPVKGDERVVQTN